MSNEDRPLRNWTTANLFSLISFVGLIFVAWAGLKEDVSTLKGRDEDQKEAIREIRGDFRRVETKVDQLLMAQGIRPPDRRNENQN